MSALLLAAGVVATTTLAGTKGPLAVDTARVSIAGTSNIHEYSATTTTVRLTRVQFAETAGVTFWDDVQKPGALAAFEIAIPAASLTSPKAGLDKNMHKALKVEQHPDIVFRLVRLEPGTGALNAIGVLRIAGVEREVAFPLKTERRENLLVVSGRVPLLMTDFGIKPPTAMLGMLKTDPKVTVTFETVLAAPQT